MGWQKPVEKISSSELSRDMHSVHCHCREEGERSEGFSQLLSPCNRKFQK